VVTVTARTAEVTLPLRVEDDIVDGAVFVPATSTATSTAIRGRELHAARKGGAVELNRQEDGDE